MAKYLVTVTYAPEGAKALLKDGGTKRRAVVESLAKSIGGKLESFYFAFGGDDAFCIVEAPDNASMAAIALNVNSSGIASVRTTLLLSPEDLDEAAKKKVTYSPPGR